MDRFDDTLFAELRELRPTPRPEFTAELDERAAAGFPRGGRPSAAAMPLAKVIGWWRSRTPARRLAPVFAVLLVGLVTVTAVIATTGGGGSGGDTIRRRTVEAPAQSAKEAGGAAGVESSVEEAPAPNRELETESGSGAGALPAVPPTAENAPLDSGPSAAAGRDIERSAYVVLGTRPGGVSAAAAKIYGAVHAADGIVLHSSVQSGRSGATGASFDLLIPNRKLDDALAAFSSIAEVRERHDATNDITAPTVGAAEELADSNARVESLLKELGDAETEGERESVEARLHEERRRHAAIRASLDRLHERASMSEVSVRIVTGDGAGAVPPGSRGDGGWGVGDALHDAAHILTIAAGVLLIALAVLGPVALIAILLWGGNRLRVRRLRERTLG